MSFVSWLVSLPLCGLVAHSAHGKLAGQEKQLAGMRAVGFPVERIGWLAAAELAAVAGLLAGLAWRPLGTAAAVGLIAYFTGALVFLFRAGLTRFAAWFPAAAFLAVSAVLLSLDVVAA
ncbi:DoxX family protein [Amycolatopsis sp. NPDC051371]|uniref:DoxX family protein n=1 Tax=Amycolatopsis sp. NPDC051371 TaxID=3155800 RepID=UPI0034456973